MSLNCSWSLLLTLTGKKPKKYLFKNSNNTASKSKIAFTVCSLDMGKIKSIALILLASTTLNNFVRKTVVKTDMNFHVPI